MGCGASLPRQKSTRRIPPEKAVSETRLQVRVIEALNIPKHDVVNLCDPYVVVEVLGDEPRAKSSLAPVKTSVKNKTSNARWDEVLELVLPGSWVERPPKWRVRFKLMDKDKVSWDGCVGTAVMALEDLLRRPMRELIIAGPQGAPVVFGGPPPRPCVLNVAVEPKSLPRAWPQPTPSTLQPSEYPKHVMIMSRGTRGDVQPFVALARGMAETLGWLVTITTELRWRSFVLAKTRNLRRGAVRFRNSGGDTARRIESAWARFFMNSRSEVLQCMMMAFAEADFFSSGPVLVHVAQQLQASHPIDLIIHSFTLTGIAMMLSELLQIPMSGFILQPSSVPSADPNWKCVGLIEGSSKALHRRLLRENAFTRHDTLKRMKRHAEANPFTSCNLPRMRKAFGLQPVVGTWETLHSLDVPMVIPMTPGSFTRPSDWPSRTMLTDFIFLYPPCGGAKPGERKLCDRLQHFIDETRAAGRKLLLMTFSSMPVSRRKSLGCVLMMIEQSQHNFGVVYVATSSGEKSHPKMDARIDALKERGLFYECENADFGVLFWHIDAFVLHGGMGTTVEALRMAKPVAVTGILLMDQRFWGSVVHQAGVGPPPHHIDDFSNICVDFADRALAGTSEWRDNAEALCKRNQWGVATDDGIEANVKAFGKLLDEGIDFVKVEPKPLKRSLMRPKSSARAAGGRKSPCPNGGESRDRLRLLSISPMTGRRRTTREISRAAPSFPRASSGLGSTSPTLSRGDSQETIDESQSCDDDVAPIARFDAEASPGAIGGKAIPEGIGAAEGWRLKGGEGEVVEIMEEVREEIVEEVRALKEDNEDERGEGSVHSGDNLMTSTGGVNLMASTGGGSSGDSFGGVSGISLGLASSVSSGGRTVGVEDEEALGGAANATGAAAHDAAALEESLELSSDFTVDQSWVSLPEQSPEESGDYAMVLEGLGPGDDGATSRPATDAFGAADDGIMVINESVLHAAISISPAKQRGSLELDVSMRSSSGGRLLDSVEHVQQVLELQQQAGELASALADLEVDEEEEVSEQDKRQREAKASVLRDHIKETRSQLEEAHMGLSRRLSQASQIDLLESSRKSPSSPTSKATWDAVNLSTPDASPAKGGGQSDAGGGSQDDPLLALRAIGISASSASEDALRACDVTDD